MTTIIIDHISDPWNPQGGTLAQRPPPGRALWGRGPWGAYATIHVLVELSQVAHPKIILLKIIFFLYNMAYARKVANNKRRTYRPRNFKAKWKLGLRTPLGSINFDSKRVKTIVKKEMDKVIETKRRCVTSSINTVHSTFYTMSPLTNITEGAGIDERQADKIHLLNWKVKLHLYTPTTANKVSYRIIILWHDTEYATGSDAFSTARLTSSNTMINYDNPLNSFVDYKQCTPVYDEIHSLPIPVQSSQITSKCFEIDLKLDKMYTFRSGTNYSSGQKQLYLLMIPFIEGGTIGTTSCGGYESQWLLTYKDA